MIIKEIWGNFSLFTLENEFLRVRVSDLGASDGGVLDVCRADGSVGNLFVCDGQLTQAAAGHGARRDLRRRHSAFR